MSATENRPKCNESGQYRPVASRLSEFDQKKSEYWIAMTEAWAMLHDRKTSGTSRYGVDYDGLRQVLIEGREKYGIRWVDVQSYVEAEMRG